MIFVFMVLAVALMVLIAETQNRPVEVEREIVEVSPDWAQDEDAVDAAKAVLRRKELEAEENRLAAEIEALSTDLKAVQVELGTY